MTESVLGYKFARVTQRRNTLSSSTAFLKATSGSGFGWRKPYRVRRTKYADRL